MRSSQTFLIAFVSMSIMTQAMTYAQKKPAPSPPRFSLPRNYPKAGKRSTSGSSF